MKIIDMNDGIRVIIDNTCTIRKGETLVETRDNFLEYMGQMFDEAIYNSLTEDITGGRGLRSKTIMIDECNHIPNTVMMQLLEDGKENYDTLREITEYVKNNGY